MKTLRNLILAAGMVTLAGCNAFSSFSEVQALNNAEAVGSPFTQALAGEYREFSNQELKGMLDYPDALHFARKGLAAASGEMVMPEPVSDWNLSEKHLQELSAARGRLVVSYDLGAREVAPALAAKAQAKFDCWIEFQEENWEDENSECKTAFQDAMNQLESMVQKAPTAPETVMPPVEQVGTEPTEPMAPEDAMYLVFFDWDSTELGSGALNVLDAVAAEVKKNPPQQVNIVGHADTSGPADYNDRLAFKRATVTRDALVSRGVPEAILAIEGRGENELLVPTPDNIREPANRRANISFK
ncbi:MAG TPA: OmpA family protein [Rhodospirillaceae bacterium]|nr:OmpA family protein [Rhodospirillaceae bacterium]